MVNQDKYFICLWTMNNNNNNLIFMSDMFMKLLVRIGPTPEKYTVVFIYCIIMKYKDLRIYPYLQIPVNFNYLFANYVVSFTELIINMESLHFKTFDLLKFKT